MILKEHLIKDASPEIKKAIDELSKVAEASKWDLYPVRLLDGGKFLALPYRQEGTVTGDWEQIKIPAGIKHQGGGVFSLEPSKKS